MIPKILAFAGSTRTQSWNKQLVRLAATGAEQSGAEITFIDLKAYPMPLYDGDLEAEEGIPENALALKRAFEAHQGFLIASPEYNSSLSAVLKNTIDWVSRPMEGESALAPFQGKVVSLLATSPGNLGGHRGLVHVRAILGNLGCIVLPNQVALPKAHELFDEDGGIKDPEMERKVLLLGAELTEFLAKLHGNVH